jgi:hypothetical protein
VFIHVTSIFKKIIPYHTHTKTEIMLANTLFISFSIVWLDYSTMLVSSTHHIKHIRTTLAFMKCNTNMRLVQTRPLISLYIVVY